MLLTWPCRRVRAAAAGGLLAVVTLVAAGSAPAASQVSGRYTTFADARLYSVNFTTVPGIAFDQLVDAGVGVAQSELDSLGQSSSFASNAYPSESVVLLPGLIAGVTGGQTSGVVPEYPLIASSSHPVRPSQRVEAGSVVLTASSDASRGAGSSRDGGNQATSDVSFDEASSTVVARSESSIGTQRISDALTLHGVRSFAEVRRTAGGELERTSGFEVAAVTILGQRMAVSAAGLDAFGEAAPIDLGGLSASLGPLLEALAADGTTIEGFPAVETEDGVSSAGLTIRDVRPASPEIASGVEAVVTEVTFGGNTVRVENRVFEDAFGTSAPLDVVAGASGATQAPGTGSAPAVGERGTSAGPMYPPNATPVVSDASILDPTSLLAMAIDISVARFYPVLFIAGCALVGITSLFRHLAVRSP